MSTEAVTRTERADLTEALRHAVHHAKRQFPRVGTVAVPTAWDRSHTFIDSLLDELEATL